MILTSCNSSNDQALQDMNGIKPASIDGSGGGTSSEISYDPIVFTGVVSATTVSDTRITLTFKPATGGSGVFVYRVYLNNDLSAPFASTGGIVADSNGDMKVTVTNLSVATSYSFIVRVYDSVQSIEDSNLDLVTKSTTSFSVPTFDGVTLVQPPGGLSGETELNIYWNTATTAVGRSVAGYRIYIATSIDAIDYASPIKTVGVATSSTITTLTNATTYFVAVRAYDDLGNTETNEIVKSATTGAPAVISFDGVTAAVSPNTADGFNELNVFWVKGSGSFDQYRVYIATTGGLAALDPSSDAPTKIVANSDASTTISTSLTANTNYDIAVVAYNSITDAYSSTYGAGSIINSITKPGEPTFAGLSSITSPDGIAGLTQVTLNWETATGAFNRYEIYQRDNGGTYSVAEDYIASDTDLDKTIGGLTTGNTYCFKIRAAYHDGTSTFHDDGNDVEECFTPQYVTPTFGGASSCTVNGTNSVTVNWTEGAGIFDFYYIWKATNGSINFADPNAMSVVVGNSSATLTGLDAGTTYTFGSRTYYTGNTLYDDNTSTVDCTTTQIELNFIDNLTGDLTSNNLLLGATKVCAQDSNGDTITTFNKDITLTLANSGDAGNLGGTKTLTPSSGCSVFTALTYAGAEAAITFKATANTASQGLSPATSIIYPGVAPPGACATESANWITAFGGCYNTASGLVVSLEVNYGAATNSNVLIWEATSVDDSSIELHDWDRTGNGDGLTLVNDFGSDGIPGECDDTGPYCQVSYSPGACHPLSEGGYDDWRMPTKVEALSLYGNNIIAHTLTTGIHYHTSKDDHPSGAYSTYVYMNSGGSGIANSMQRSFCVRDAEVNYVPAVMPSNIGVATATASTGGSGAGAVDLTWNTPVGSFSGYYLYYAEDTTGEIDIDWNTPQVVLRKGSNSKTITGLNSSTTYEFAIKSVWTNKTNKVTDANTTVLTATTKDIKLNISLFKGERLHTGELPVMVEAVESITGDRVSIDGVTITLTQIAGSGALSGTTSTTTLNGLAKFSALQYSANDSLTLVASATGKTSSDPATKTVLTTSDESCSDFSETVYPEHGACFYSEINKVFTAAKGRTISYQGWEASADNSDAEVSDTNDADGDGRFDNFDTTYAGGADITGSTTESCHQLVLGGQSDWQRPTIAELRSLASKESN